MILLYFTVNVFTVSQVYCIFYRTLDLKKFLYSVGHFFKCKNTIPWHCIYLSPIHPHTQNSYLWVKVCIWTRVSLVTSLQVQWRRQMCKVVMMEQVVVWDWADIQVYHCTEEAEEETGVQREGLTLFCCWLVVDLLLSLPQSTTENLLSLLHQYIFCHFKDCWA